MAGIGWRLERLIHRGTLWGAAAAYATGASVMALPGVLTTTVLLTLPILIGRSSLDYAQAETTVAAAYLVALLVDGPLQVVLSRHVADRLYERRHDAIAAPFCRGLAGALLICGIAATAVLSALGHPPRAALWGGALSASVGGAWTSLSVGGGLCSPALVLGAVAAGAGFSLAAATLLVAGLGFGVPGYLFGLLSGQVLTLCILLAGIFRALPDATDEDAALLPAFREYSTLAGAGLAFNAALWADKFIVARLGDAAAASAHAAASTLAWFTAIPCLAWIFVEVETSFHRRFQRLLRSLGSGAPLGELRRGLQSLRNETTRLFRGAAGAHAGVVVVVEVTATFWIGRLGLPAGVLLPFRFLVVAAGLLALALLGLILLYYFDLRRDALCSALTLLVGVGVLTVIACRAGLPPSLGTVLGAAGGAADAWRRARNGAANLLRSTLLRQPFGTERLRSPALRVGYALDRTS